MWRRSGIPKLTLTTGSTRKGCLQGLAAKQPRRVAKSGQPGAHRVVEWGTHLVNHALHALDRCNTASISPTRRSSAQPASSPERTNTRHAPAPPPGPQGWLSPPARLPRSPTPAARASPGSEAPTPPPSPVRRLVAERGAGEAAGRNRRVRHPRAGRPAAARLLGSVPGEGPLRRGLGYLPGRNRQSKIRIKPRLPARWARCRGTVPATRRGTSRWRRPLGRPGVGSGRVREGGDRGGVVGAAQPAETRRSRDVAPGAEAEVAGVPLRILGADGQFIILLARVGRK